MKVRQKLHQKEHSKQETLTTMWSPEPATSLSGKSSDLLQEYHTSSLSTDTAEDISPCKQSEVSCDHIMPFLQTLSNSQVFQVASPHAETAVGGANTKLLIGHMLLGTKKKLENSGSTDSQTHVTGFC